MAGRTEARIFTSIWRDPHFVEMDRDAQWLYFHLLSQDDLSYCGVMPLREPRWAAKATGMQTSDIERALKVLEASPRRFVVVDHEKLEVLIRSLIRRDGIWRQPNLLKLARESAAQIDSLRIKAVLLGELRRIPLEQTGSSLVKTLVEDFIQDLEMAGPYPSDYPTDHPNHDGSGDAAEHGSDVGSAHPSDEDHARARAQRGTGERNGSNQTGSPIPLYPVTPDPLTAQRDRKRGTRLPEPFVVTDDMAKWARSECPHIDVRLATEEWCDYWRGVAGRGGTKLDWPATWRNGMRRAESLAGPRRRYERPQHQPFLNPADPSAYEGDL